MLRVLAIPGEPTRYRVEGNTVQCTNPSCGKLYSRLRSQVHIGDRCPACVKRAADALRDGDETPAVGTLDVRFHIVDISEFSGNGACACEYFEFRLRPKLSALLPDKRALGLHRCSHIVAAREFCLDALLLLHDRERHAKAGRQREENQP